MYIVDYFELLLILSLMLLHQHILHTQFSNSLYFSIAFEHLLRLRIDFVESLGHPCFELTWIERIFFNVSDKQSGTLSFVFLIFEMFLHFFQIVASSDTLITLFYLCVLSDLFAFGLC